MQMHFVVFMDADSHLLKYFKKRKDLCECRSIGKIVLYNIEG